MTPSESYYLTDGAGWRVTDGMGHHFAESSIEDAQKTAEFFINLGHGKEYHVYRDGEEPELVCICAYDPERDEIVAHGPDVVV